MTATPADRQRNYRNRKRGAPPRAPLPCGTIAAYRRHQRAHEPPCQPCRDVWAAWQRANYQRRKGT